MGMISRFADHRFLKQVKNPFRNNALLISSPLSHSPKERETNSSREQKKAAVFANRIN